jgi:glycosyltransferase involved in cell wall biosynthesis
MVNLLLINKTKDEEKHGGPYKWAKELAGSLQNNKEVNFDSVNLNWKSLFNGDFPKATKKVKKSDIVHVYVSNLGIVFLSAYAKLRGKKLVYTCHGNFYEEWKGKSPWLFVKYYSLAKFADYLTFPSNYIGDIISKKMNKQSNVIYLACSLVKSKTETKKHVKTKNRKYIFLEVTSFDYEKKAKGVSYLTRAFKKFNRIYPNSELLIIGSGDLLETYKEKYGGSNIEFLGKMPRKKVQEYMQGSNCFIHISGLDTLGLTVIEAAKLGKPIIASNIGGIPEISKDVHLTKNNTASILDNMLEVYETNKKETDYRHIGKFEEGCSAQKFIGFYKNILKKPLTTK